MSCCCWLKARVAPDRFELHQTRNSDTLLDDAASWVSYKPKGGAKWTPALVAADAFSTYEKVKSSSCEALADWGRTYLGSVTGNNNYFALRLAAAASAGLCEDDLIKVSPPGSRHLRGLVFSTKAWEAAVDDEARGYLFWPRNDTGAASDYIRSGEASGVSQAYKCRSRAPWWRVPLVEVPDIFLTYMDHDRPRLISNDGKLHILNSIYGLKLLENRRETGMKLLPIAALNSVTLLGSEVVGRAYGGGLLKLEPREADKLPMPSLERVRTAAESLEAIRPQLATALRQNDLDSATRLVDPILFPEVSEIELQNVRSAREVLFQRRKARGGRG